MADQTDLPTLIGRPVIWASKAPQAGFYFKFAPGAFTETIRRDDQFIYCSHLDFLVIARRLNGTLRLWEDSTGLALSIKPPSTQYNSDIVELIRSGTVTEMSVGFQVIEDKWTQEPDGLRCLVIKCKLTEVSIVSRGALIGTSIGIARNVIPAAPAALSQPNDLDRLRQVVAAGERRIQSFGASVKLADKPATVNRLAMPVDTGKNGHPSIEMARFWSALSAEERRAKGTGMHKSEVQEILTRVSGGKVKPSTSATVKLTGPMDERNPFLKALQEVGPVDVLRVLIDSPGGEAETFVKALRAHPAKQIVTIAVGEAYSAAGIVFMQGRVRLMTPNSCLMIHDARTSATNDTSDLAIETSERYCDLWASRMRGVPRDLVREWMHKCVYLNAANAIRFGAAHGLDETTPELFKVDTTKLAAPVVSDDRTATRAFGVRAFWARQEARNAPQQPCGPGLVPLRRLVHKA